MDDYEGNGEDWGVATGGNYCGAFMCERPGTITPADCEWEGGVLFASQWSDHTGGDDEELFVCLARRDCGWKSNYVFVPQLTLQNKLTIY